MGCDKMARVISVQEQNSAVWRPLLELPRHSDLILQFAKRELTGRYRGSALGFLWSLLTPAVMIAIYTFIFAGIFRARFGAHGSPWDYALYLFCGLLPWSAFQESLQISSTTIIAHTNLVKRVVFPLETLPASHSLAAIANQLFGTIVLLTAVTMIRREIHLTLLWLPVLLALQFAMMLGASWFVAALGVFVRDTAQVVTLALTAWMFLTPIIYPASVVPERYRALVNLNPLTALVESYRRVMIEGAMPDVSGLLFFAAFAALSFFGGYFWFAKARRNFADIV